MQSLDEQIKDEYGVIYPYFDIDFYKLKYGISASEDPILHYIERGAFELFDPSPFFSTKFYIEENPSVASSSINPFAHYLIFGVKDGLLPRRESDICRQYPYICLSDDDLFAKAWGIPCIINDYKVRSGIDGSLGEFVARLNNTDSSAVILKRDSKDWLIAFSGKGEKFFYIGKMIKFWGNILFLRDETDTCYAGNPALPSLHRLSEYLDYMTGFRSGKTILIGQSYGGYCALYQSSHVGMSLTFAFSPQAYHSVNYPNNIFFEKGIPKCNSHDCVPDLLDHISRSRNSPRYVISGMSEASHDTKYYWGDIIGATMLAGTGKVSSIIVNQKEHSTLKYVDAVRFFELLKENYHEFMLDSERGAKLIADGAIYYKRDV